MKPRSCNAAASVCTSSFTETLFSSLFVVFSLDLLVDEMVRGSDAHHVALVHLGAHGQLDDEPGGVPQDEGGDEVPVDDVPQAADAPERRADENKLRCFCLFFFNLFLLQSLRTEYDFMLRGKDQRWKKKRSM